MKWLYVLAGMTVWAGSVCAGSYGPPEGLPYQPEPSDLGWGGTPYDDSGPDFGKHPAYRDLPRDEGPRDHYGYRADPGGRGGASTPNLPAYARDAPTRGYSSGVPWDDEPREPQGFGPSAHQGAGAGADHRSGYGYNGYSFQGDSRAQEVAVPGYRFRGDPVPGSGYQGAPYFGGQYNYRPLSQAERDRVGQGSGWRPLPSNPPTRYQDPPGLDRSPGAAYGFEPGLGVGQ